MTREEAIKILSRIWGGNPQHDLANSYADAFVALGMLKLEEPKSAVDRAVHAIESIQFIERYPGAIVNALDEAGLKIVEK